MYNLLRTGSPYVCIVYILIIIIMCLHVYILCMCLQPAVLSVGWGKGVCGPQPPAVVIARGVHEYM